MKTLASFLTTLILLGAGWYGIWIVLGETKITASFEGSQIDGARVRIDNKEVGKTPYTVRLLPGTHTIQVRPPDGYDTDLFSEELHIFTAGKGMDYEVRFHLPETELEPESAEDATAKNF